MKNAARRLKAEGVTPRSAQRSRLIPRLSFFICAVLFLASKVEGDRKLREFLNAPKGVQDAFDKRVEAAIRKSLADERAIYEEVGDDPAWTPPPADPIPVKWDASWSNRAKRPVVKGGKFVPYCRETDPLLAIDVRTVWEQLTGHPIRGEASICPLPDHEDTFPSCGVKAEYWRCNRCDVGGTLIDLGAILYGLEPRGKDFHQIRERLFAALGMEEWRAA